MCFELTPHARIPDTRIPQFMQPWWPMSQPMSSLRWRFLWNRSSGWLKTFFFLFVTINGDWGRPVEKASCMFNHNSFPCQLWFFVGSWIHSRPEHCPLGHQALQHIVLKVQFQNSVWSLFDYFIKYAFYLVYSPNADFGLKIIDFGLARRLNEDGHTDVKELQVVKFSS